MWMMAENNEISLCSSCGLYVVYFDKNSKNVGKLCSKCIIKTQSLERKYMKNSVIDLSVRELKKPIDVILNHSETSDKYHVPTAQDISSIATFSVKKHEEWIMSPLSIELRSVPGIGESSEKALKSAGIDTTWHLIAKYMSYGPGKIKEFTNFLNQFSALAPHKDTITRAIAEKVATSFGADLRTIDNENIKAM